MGGPETPGFNPAEMDKHFSGEVMSDQERIQRRTNRRQQLRQSRIRKGLGVVGSILAIGGTAKAVDVALDRQERSDAITKEAQQPVREGIAENQARNAAGQVASGEVAPSDVPAPAPEAGNPVARDLYPEAPTDQTPVTPPAESLNPPVDETAAPETPSGGVAAGPEPESGGVESP